MPTESDGESRGCDQVLTALSLDAEAMQVVGAAPGDGLGEWRYSGARRCRVPARRSPVGATGVAASSPAAAVGR